MRAPEARTSPPFSCGTEDALSDTATPSALRVTVGGVAPAAPCDARYGESADQVPRGRRPRGCPSRGRDARLALHRSQPRLGHQQNEDFFNNMGVSAWLIHISPPFKTCRAQKMKNPGAEDFIFMPTLNKIPGSRSPTWPKRLPMDSSKNSQAVM